MGVGRVMGFGLTRFIWREPSEQARPRDENSVAGVEIGRASVEYTPAIVLGLKMVAGVPFPCGVVDWRYELSVERRARGDTFIVEPTPASVLGLKMEGVPLPCEAADVSSEKETRRP